MRRKYYFLPLASDVYTTVRDCSEGVWNKTSEKRRRPLHLFPASDSFAIDTLGPLSKTSNGNQFELVKTDRHLKLSLAVPTSRVTAVHIVSMFVDHWIISYRIVNMC